MPTSFTTGAHRARKTAPTGRTTRTTATSCELQVDGGKHDVDWILGLYYAAEDNGIRFDIPIFNGTQQGTVGWQGSFIQPKETVESKAVFGQATWNVSDSLHLTGGARYTSDDRKKTRAAAAGAGRYDADVPQVPISTGHRRRPDAGLQRLRRNDGKYYKSTRRPGWRALDTDVEPERMVYASVSTGYKSGGLQDGGRRTAETLTNYEVGIEAVASSIIT